MQTAAIFMNRFCFDCLFFFHLTIFPCRFFYTLLTVSMAKFIRVGGVKFLLFKS